MKERGWDYVDFVYVIGDAYVDHPSFGHAIISRILEAHGYRVAFVSQPSIKDPRSIGVYGTPRLGFIVMSGNMDSMVNHYYVSKKKRREDAYTPGGKAGRRPDYAVNEYVRLIRQTFKDTPVIIGGIEASLRRMAHYDYWMDELLPSVLISSGADILLYGMGERAIVQVADALDSGISISDITFIKGTAYKSKQADMPEGILLPSYEKLLKDKKLYAESFYKQYTNTDPFSGKILIEPYENEGIYVVQNTPSEPLTSLEMDDVYSLPYERTYHPSYEAAGGVPAISEIKFSITSCRGCIGSCNFCALSFHQGRIIQARSHESIIREAEIITKMPDFKGYIHDVGGPTANFRQPACKKQLKSGACPEKKCLVPEPCKNLIVDHSDYISLLRKLRAVKGVKKVFVRSGIRFDYVMADKDKTFINELIKYHVSGQLKVAPEHVSDNVLYYMDKPKHSVYEGFCRSYRQINEKNGLNQFTVPYLMSSHPGSTLKDAITLAEYIRDMGYKPEQVQDFYPTPSTISTCMYYTGLDPRTMKPVYIPKDPHEKEMQRALIQYKDPKNYDLVKEALIKEDRKDLIGFDKKCLIPPRKIEWNKGKAEKRRPDKKNEGNSSKGQRKGSATRQAANKVSKRRTK